MVSISQPSPDERQRMEQHAERWMAEGKEMLKEGAAALSKSTYQSDIVAMSKASELIREGQNKLASGDSTYKTLKQGTAPDEIALKWFRSQLNLTSTTATKQPTRILGMLPFQFFVCLLMLGSTIFALTIYLRRMRRAYQLLGRLEVGERTVPGSIEVASDKSTTQSNRVLLSIERKKLCRLRLSRTFPETPDVKTFRFVSCDKGPIPFSYLPRFMIAWPSAQIAVMGGNQAADTILSIEAAKMPEEMPEEEAEAILDRIRQTYEATASPYHAAAHLWVDAIIDPRTTHDVLEHLLRVACRVAPEQGMRVGVYPV